MARAWLLCWALTVLPAAANRISFNYAADLNKDFLEQYQKEKEAKRQAQQEAKLQRQAEAAGAASAPAAPAPAPAPTQAEFVVARSAGGLPLGKFKLPAVVGLGLGAYRGLQVVQLRRLTSQLSAGQSELAELGASPVSLPAHKGGIRGQIAAHAEALRTLETAKAEAAATAERKAALLKEVSAAYAQLEQKIPASLAKQSEAELGALLAGLAERVQACGGPMTHRSSVASAPRLPVLLDVLPTGGRHALRCSRRTGPWGRRPPTTSALGRSSASRRGATTSPRAPTRCARCCSCRCPPPRPPRLSTGPPANLPARLPPPASGGRLPSRRLNCGPHRRAPRRRSWAARGRWTRASRRWGRRSCS